MLGLRVDDEIFLAMPLDAHAEPLFALVDAERDRIGAWLSAWDGVTSPGDERRRLRERRQALTAAPAARFGYEGRLRDAVRAAGRYQDQAVYALLAPDWAPPTRANG